MHQERCLTHSVRNSFYNQDRNREERTFAESQMKKRDKLSFKEEMTGFWIGAMTKERDNRPFES